MDKQLNFGQTIKKKRLDSGLSLHALAKKMGYSAPYLLAIENGEKHVPSTEFIKKVATALDLCYDSLLPKAALKGGTKPLQVLPEDEQAAIVSFYATCVHNNISAKEGFKHFEKVAKQFGTR